MSEQLTEWPPYGALPRAYAQAIEHGPFAPKAWKAGEADSVRESSWLDWRQDVISIINEDLWPSWDSLSLTWKDPNFTKMNDLTNADFDILEKLNKIDKIIDSPPVPINASASIPNHRQFFLDEDGRPNTLPLGARYYSYDVTLPADRMNQFPKLLMDVLDKNCGTASLQIKSIIQRPRAYQSAKLLGRDHLWEIALTSMSPSMSSGHCFEGCMMGAGVFESWLESGFIMSASQRKSLQQFTVDIGDRRVFAGVHFPSDNLASWIVSLKLSKNVFKRNETQIFLWESITNFSKIYREIQNSGKEIYKSALDRIISHDPSI